MVGALARPGRVHHVTRPAPGVAVAGHHVATTPGGWTVVAEGWAHPVAGDADGLATVIGQALEVGREVDLSQLRGEYAAIAHHQPTRRLVALRDPLGGRPLFWWRGGGTTIVSSAITALLADPRVPREPNEGAIAEQIADRPTTPLETTWQGIERVPTGHLLDLGPTGAPRAHRFFTAPTRCAPVAEPAAALRAATERAVAAAADGSSMLGADLSGGMDSSTVVGVARALGLQVRTYTLTFPGLPNDEEPWFRATERWSGHPTVRVRATPPHDDERRALLRQRGQPGSMIMGQLRTRRRAARDGVDIMLTGHWGDELLGSLGWGADDLLATGHLLAARRHPLWKGSLRTMLARTFRDRLLRHAGSRMRRAVLDPPPAWVHPRLVERTHLHDRLARVPTTSQRLPSRRLLETLLDGWGIQARAEGDLGDIEPHPDIRSPLGSLELLELAFRVPELVKAPAGDLRHLHRRAFRDVLAPAVLGRRGKTQFAASWHEHRLASDVRIGPRSRIVEFGWVHLPSFTKMVRRVDAAAEDHAFHPHLTAVATIEDIELWAQEWL